MLILWGVTFASNPTIVNHSYTVDGDDVRIYRTNNSNGGSVDINLFNPNSQEWMHYWTVDLSKEYFSYTMQRSWDQSVWMIPDNGWDDVKFVIKSENENLDTAPVSEDAVRTVIPVAPKTWPSENLIGIIIATLVIFGWYIFIKKQADL